MLLHSWKLFYCFLQLLKTSALVWANPAMGLQPVWGLKLGLSWNHVKNASPSKNLFMNNNHGYAVIISTGFSLSDSDPTPQPLASASLQAPYFRGISVKGGGWCRDGGRGCSSTNLKTLIWV